MTNAKQIAAKAALDFYLDQGVDECVSEQPINRISEQQNLRISETPNPQASEIRRFRDSEILLGKNHARIEAAKLAAAASTIEELREAIAAFDGIAIKKTATNLVFCDGNPKAKIMLIGEAPGADEDRQGTPFVGVSGQLLDNILACINLARNEEDPQKAIYISNVLNWRPPGNRTPSPAEIEVSLPFIERHIQLINPKLIILCGGVSAKALLGSEHSVSKLRKTWHDYTPQTSEFAKDANPIPAIATYHPDYLLRTPTQKRAVWADMLMTQAKLKELGI